MGDFFIDGDDGNFIIESGSVPIFKISGSTTYISGSLLPFEEGASSFSELGSEARPWKEIYVESASINFVDTEESVGAGARLTKFSKDDLDDVLAGRPPRGVLPLSRFALSLSFEARIAAVNKWYGRGRSQGGMGGLLSTAFASSDPNGGNITAQSAMTGQVFIAPRDLTIHRATCFLYNGFTNDDIIVTMFKATTTNANAGTNNIGLTRLGSEFAPTMDRRNTYVSTQNMTDTMDAGQGLIITAHVTSYAGQSYPNIMITLDGQYR